VGLIKTCGVMLDKAEQKIVGLQKEIDSSDK